MSTIYQSIELLAKEKGIEAQIIFDAVKDAIILAARKQFKNVGEMTAEVDPKKGIQVFALRKIVEEVADPLNEWTLEEAKKNKDALMKVLKPHDVTNDRLDEVSMALAT